MSHDHSFQKVCFIFYTSLPVFYEDHHKECPLTKVEEVLVLEIQFWRSLQSTFITASSYRWNQLASNNFLNQREIEDNNQFGNYLQTLFFDKTKSSEKITLVEGDKSFVQNAKNAEILDQLKKDRQIVLRVLRVDRQILRVDRRVLRVVKQVLRMDKRVLRVGKGVLRVGEEYYQ